MDDNKKNSTIEQKDKKEEVTENPEKKQEDKEKKESKIGDDKNEMKQCKEERDDFKNKYLRALADYQNFERRVREERGEVIALAQGRIIEELLPFLDTLYKAEVFVKDAGLAMVKTTFLQQLEKLGVKEIELLHKEYDPHTAEAVE